MVKGKSSQLMAYAALAAVCIIWGTTYLALRVGVTQFPPFLFSMLRFLSAGAILFAVVVWGTQVPFPKIQNIINQAIGGFFMITLGISIVGWAETYVSSGLAAIICSVMPIWTILINFALNRNEKPNLLVGCGLLAGLAGIVLIFAEHLHEFATTNYTFAIAAIFAANICWALGTVWIKKKNQESNPFLNAALQMFFGGLFLTPLSLLFDQYSTIQWSGQVLVSLSYLILIGSVAGYACYSYAIKKLPMTIVSLYAYINPIVAVILGWLLLDEKLTVQIALAILLTVAGIYLVNRGYNVKSSPKTPITLLFWRKRL
jgi:drug/metabolite transporter (DMT)-like permease